jgi:hypothetical protein
MLIADFQIGDPTTGKFCLRMNEPHVEVFDDLFLARRNNLGDNPCIASNLGFIWAKMRASYLNVLH